MLFDHIFIELLPFLYHMYSYMHTVLYVLYIFTLQHILCVYDSLTHRKDLCHMLCISVFAVLLKWNCFDSKQANLYVVFCPYVHLNRTALHRREWVRLNNNNNKWTNINDDEKTTLWFHVENGLSFQCRFALMILLCKKNQKYVNCKTHRTMNGFRCRWFGKFSMKTVRMRITPF